MDETRTGTFKSSCQSLGEEIVALFLRLSRNDFLSSDRLASRKTTENRARNGCDLINFFELVMKLTLFVVVEAP